MGLMYTHTRTRNLTPELFVPNPFLSCELSPITLYQYRIAKYH